MHNALDDAASGDDGPDDAALRELAAASVRVLLDGQHHGGAYVACPTFEPYRHAWLRDGAFCALALSRAGHADSAERFFCWAAETVAGQSGLVARAIAGADGSGEAYLPARYALDGRRLDDGWWDRQPDGYGTWLWVMEQHRRRHGRLGTGHAEGIRLTVDYLVARWAAPSFDWWEEHDGHRHTATLAAIAAGLRASAGWDVLDHDRRARAAATADRVRAAIRTRGVRNGRLTKWLDDSDSVDASLIACATPFDEFEPDDPVFAATLAEIERALVHGDGVHRHPADTFYGGGQWLLLAGLLGLHYARVGRRGRAGELLRWIATRHRDHELPEQVRDHMLAPEHLDEWLRRWGEPACPLLWSHAMYLLLALDLGVPLPATG